MHGQAAGNRIPIPEFMCVHPGQFSIGDGAFSPFTHPSFLTAVELAVLAITWGNSSPNAPFGGAASGFLFTEVFAPNTMSLQSRREAELLCQCLP